MKRGKHPFKVPGHSIDGSATMGIEVVAEFSDTGALAVHPSVGMLRGNWTISHVRSGFGIATVPRYDDATGLCAIFDELDWSGECPNEIARRNAGFVSKALERLKS